MNQIFRFRMLGAFAGLLCGAIACGDSSSDGGAAIKLATNARVGNHLVDGKGRSLYYVTPRYEGDLISKSRM
jgi:hypothetical protein